MQITQKKTNATLKEVISIRKKLKVFTNKKIIESFLVDTEEKDDGTFDLLVVMSYNENNQQKGREL